jgi:tetratricopeptide (TPR) repeat protein
MNPLRRWLPKFPRPRFGRMFAPLIGGVRSLWKAGPLRLFRQVGRLTALAFWGVIGWVAALNWRLFLQGLPALAVGAAAVTVLCFAFFTSTQEVEARYRERALSAGRAKDYTEALACYERLAGFQNDRAETLFEMALIAEQAGQPERCQLLMNQLAAPEHQGHPKAHLWQAVRILSQPAQTQQLEQVRQLAETHLMRALDGGLDDKEAAHGLLGDLYLARGLLAEAESHLLIAAKKRPQIRLTLARLYARQGNLVRAKTEAQAVANVYSTAARADLYNHFARFRWAEAMTFLEEFPQAVTILDAGLTGTREEFYRAALARVYATWFDQLGRVGSPNPGFRLMLLERGLRYDPKNMALLDRLLNVTRMSIGADLPASLAAAAVGWSGTLPATLAAGNLVAYGSLEKEAARSTLRRMLAEGQGSAQIHFALGVDAWDQGRTKEARFYWERANQLAPDLPVVANNLAWLLYQTSPDELNKALELINLAIAKAPRETNFRDTRGHIYLKMGKFKEALEDLEAALPQSPNSPDLHRSLATVYTRLEMPALAAEHERQAVLKAAQRNKSKPAP